MPRRVRIEPWGLADYLFEQTRPTKKDESRENNGFLLVWDRDNAPSFKTLKQLTKDYLVRNSMSFEYRGQDVIKEKAQGFEAVCTGYAGLHFKMGFSDVQTKITLVRYIEDRNVFIKCYENWRFTPPSLIAGMFGG